MTKRMHQQGSERALFTSLKVFVSLVLIGLGSVIMHKLSFTFQFSDEDEEQGRE